MWCPSAEQLKTDLGLQILEASDSLRSALFLSGQENNQALRGETPKSQSDGADPQASQQQDNNQQFLWSKSATKKKESGGINRAGDGGWRKGRVEENTVE